MTDACSESSSHWILDNDILQPSVEHLQHLQLWLSKRKGDDSSIIFEFSQPAAKPLEILSSRLEYVGGPFAAICEQPFAEKQSKNVSLSTEDDPVTFGIIRNYLYMNPISPMLEDDWEDVTVDAIVKVIRAAHRWQLTSLFAGFCNILVFYRMFSSEEDVVQAIALARLPDVPQDLQVYFWTSVGAFYPDIAIHSLVEDTNLTSVDNGNNKEDGEKDSEEDNDKGSEEENDEDSEEDNDEDSEEDNDEDSGEDSNGSVIDIINTKQRENVHAAMAASPSQFPDLWALAKEQKMIKYLLHSIINNMMELEDYENLIDCSSSLYHDHLEMIVLGFLEPRISDDSHFLDVLFLLRWSAGRWTTLIQNDKSYKTYSSRAMALVARNLLSSDVPRDEFRSSWKINLHSMENIRGIKKHFLFPMSKMLPSCRRCTHPGVPKDPLGGECEAGISFSISIAKRMSVAGYSIDTRWNRIAVGTLGKDFSAGYARVKVINNECKCLLWNPLTSRRTSAVIAQHVYMLHETEGFRRLLISENLLADYQAAHGRNCRVTISIEVREK